MAVRNAAGILIVDDVPSQRLATEVALAELGEEVTTADSGPSALRLLLTADFAVIILDVNMPEMDGFETAAAIRMEAWGEHVRIVALTGWGQQEDMRRTREAGFVAHLVKPLKTYDLLKLLQEKT